MALIQATQEAAPLNNRAPGKQKPRTLRWMKQRSPVGIFRCSWMEAEHRTQLLVSCWTCFCSFLTRTFHRNAAHKSTHCVYYLSVDSCFWYFFVDTVKWVNVQMIRLCDAAQSHFWVVRCKETWAGDGNNPVCRAHTLCLQWCAHPHYTRIQKIKTLWGVCQSPLRPIKQCSLATVFTILENHFIRITRLLHAIPTVCFKCGSISQQNYLDTDSDTK